jgi:hypothetical protein
MFDAVTHKSVQMLQGLVINFWEAGFVEYVIEYFAIVQKQILTIGFQIPGFSNHYVDFYHNFSLMDADFVLISPDSIEPHGE